MSSHRVLLSVTLVQFIQCINAVNVVAEFTSDTEINHLALDTSNENVYLGAVNRIYHLNVNLVEIGSVVTGPVQDNRLCLYPEGKGSSCTTPSGQIVDTRSTDNVNKILLVDAENNHLITCGSVLQGICSIRNLRNITIGTTYAGDTTYFVSANDPASSTVAFLGPGSSSQKMYVGTTFTTDGQDSGIRGDAPAVSSSSSSSSSILFRNMNSWMTMEPKAVTME